MWIKGTQTESQAKSIIGLVWDNPVLHPYKVLKKWNVKHHDYDYFTGDDDPDLIISDHIEHIPPDCCRECFKKVEPYEDKFYAKKMIDSELYSVLYSAGNGYCRDCAIKLGSEYNINTDPLRIVGHEEIHPANGNGDTIVRDIYNDGSVVEYDSGNIPTPVKRTEEKGGKKYVDAAIR